MLSVAFALAISGQTKCILHIHHVGLMNTKPMNYSEKMHACPGHTRIFGSPNVWLTLETNHLLLWFKQRFRSKTGLINGIYGFDMLSAYIFSVSLCVSFSRFLCLCSGTAHATRFSSEFTYARRFPNSSYSFIVLLAEMADFLQCEPS